MSPMSTQGVPPMRSSVEKVNPCRALPKRAVVMIDLGPTGGTDKVLKLADEFRVDVDRAVGELRMAFGHDAVLL